MGFSTPSTSKARGASPLTPSLRSVLPCDSPAPGPDRPERNPPALFPIRNAPAGGFEKGASHTCLYVNLNRLV